MCYIGSHAVQNFTCTLTSEMGRRTHALADALLEQYSFLKGTKNHMKGYLTQEYKLKNGKKLEENWKIPRVGKGWVCGWLP